MTAELKWLSDKLSSAKEDEKFITMMHIYETSNLDNNWKEDEN